MSERDGAAKRRRERRLRSWLRHERQTVAMELAAALHHSRDGGGPCRTLPALRGLKAASSGEEAGVESSRTTPLRGLKTLPPGMRPEQLPEAPGPQRCDRTVRGTSVGAPVLAVQSLRGFDGVDDTAARFLLQQALKKEKEEEEEERRLAVALEKEKLKVAMKRKEVEAVEESSAGSSAAPAAPAEPFMPRRVFEVVKKGCVDTLRSPLASTAAKDAARKRLAQLLDQERRGGVG